MPAYMSRGAGVLLVVRTEHLVGLRELTLALYHSNATLGETMSVAEVRKTIARVFEQSGTDVSTKVADYISESREHHGDGSLVGSDTDKRLHWARTLVLRAYRKDFEHFPQELAAFHALSPENIA
ncbi:hypothetical protein [Streptomyces sp. NPDC088752]|uniref:hypothetical protein n=1 Tax=Streptomyces sp. NPDC088752 TaxID=3154963 RepID=UPI00341E6B5E